MGLAVRAVIMIKYILILFLSTQAFADNHPPKYLEGGKITLETKAGKSKALSKNWAIVPRKNLSKYKKCPSSCQTAPQASQAPVQTIEKVVEKEIEVVREVVIIPKNRFMLHLGGGFMGLEETRDEQGNILFSQKVSPVVGGTYLRHIKKNISVGATLYSNMTASFSVGFDY